MAVPTVEVQQPLLYIPTQLERDLYSQSSSLPGPAKGIETEEMVVSPSRPTLDVSTQFDSQLECSLPPTHNQEIVVPSTQVQQSVPPVDISIPYYEPQPSLSEEIVIPSTQIQRPPSPFDILTPFYESQSRSPLPLHPTEETDVTLTQEKDSPSEFENNEVSSPLSTHLLKILSDEVHYDGILVRHPSKVSYTIYEADDSIYEPRHGCFRSQFYWLLWTSLSPACSTRQIYAKSLEHGAQVTHRILTMRAQANLPHRCQPVVEPIDYRRSFTTSMDVKTYKSSANFCHCHSTFNCFFLQTPALCCNQNTWS
jgi:hypothetical protein